VVTGASSIHDYYMAKHIKGNGDGPNGANETYSIPGRGSNLSRRQVVKEVKQGKHPNFGVVRRGGQEFVRGKPDRSKKNNVNGG